MPQHPCTSVLSLQCQLQRWLLEKAHSPCLNRTGAYQLIQRLFYIAPPPTHNTQSMPTMQTGITPHLARDTIAALVLVVLLLPQSLAYAMLAGLPPQAGIYASLLPLLMYAMLGSSSNLSVGPMALIALMTAAATAKATGTLSSWQAAMLLSLLSGIILLLMGWLRMGFMANFLSYPVTTGFIGAAGLLIVLSQCKHLLGITAYGDNAPQILSALYQELPNGNASTAAIGATALLLLLTIKQLAKRTHTTHHRTARFFKWLHRIAPVIVTAAGILFVSHNQWQIAGPDWRHLGQGVSILRDIPTGIPTVHLPVSAVWNTHWLKELLLPATLIALVSFGQSVSMAQSLAARQRQRIQPNRELIALGACNAGAALSGGFPVTASLSRSATVYEAGAATRLHGAIAALFMVLASLFLLPLLYYLPHAVLAAIVISSVLPLIDIPAMIKPWRYAPHDATAALLTFAITLLTGIETGLLLGVLASLLLHIYRSSTPHIAVVGLVPGTQHFRNVQRHSVQCTDNILGIRLDESLYFANARFLEDFINHHIALHPQLRHVVLMCSGINDIDASGIKTLASIEQQLRDAGCSMHLSEVKGPVMDRLNKAGFSDNFSGTVYLTQYAAIQALQSRH